MTKNRLSIAQLNNYIKGVFDDELILKNITVFGEVFEKTTSGGIVFITLRDGDDLLRCTKFGGDFNAKIGDKVTVVGSVEYYAKGNRISFIFREYSIFGEGNIRKEFLALYEKLSAEGLFANRPPLPRFVKKVGVITSETGAVIHDFLSVLVPVCPYVDVYIYPVKVQGINASSEIINAINWANADDRACDLLVLARGGGANSDLESFNDEMVARAVASSKIPIVSAIGHQVDYTLSDYCSSFRAGTPSIAGEKVSKINEEFISRFILATQKISSIVNAKYLDKLNKYALTVSRLGDNANSVIYKSKLKLTSLCAKLSSASEKIYTDKIDNVSALGDRLQFSVNENVNNQREKLSVLCGRLDALSPLKLISSGYAKVTKNAKLVDSVIPIEKGDEIAVYFHDGYIEATVDSVKKK
ncbi:MAG: exodeoxyribonuclease VII large subunit [Clostridia bacterium]|nr:exodeoxyribonuclease VII large subunit [Clostridia bacterium]